MKYKGYTITAHIDTVEEWDVNNKGELTQLIRPLQLDDSLAFYVANPKGESIFERADIKEAKADIDLLEMLGGDKNE